jgi:hypothetical protein
MGNTWITCGFEAFRAGEFGNAGQNIYVSKNGVLQRIFQFDLNHNGYFDLIFPSTQNHHESAPSYVYTASGERIDLPAQGGVGGIVADLNGNGYADIVISNTSDAAQPYASADIYFGSDELYGEKYHLRIPAPYSTGVAAGRFKTKSGVMALAFAQPVYNQVRIFYPGKTNIYEWRNFLDLPIECDALCAADLDGDGYDELITRENNGNANIRVYWGGKDGISPDCYTELPALDAAEIKYAEPISFPHGVGPTKTVPFRLVQALKVNGETLFTRTAAERVIFYGCDAERRITERFSVSVPEAVSVISGDLDGDGIADLLIASRSSDGKGGQVSFIYWGGKDGFSDYCRTTIPTCQAVDATILSDKRLIIGQGTSGKSYSTDSPIFKVTQDRQVLQCGAVEGGNLKRIFGLFNPGREEEILTINKFTRSAIGALHSPLYWGGPDGYSPDRVTPLPCRNSVDAIAADLNDDGWAEVIICNNSEEAKHLDEGHHVHYFGPEGFESERSSLIPVNVGYNAMVADFDRDGALEVASIAENYSAITFFRCHLDGSFERLYSVDMKQGGGLRRPVAVDINRNGYLDLAIADNSGDKVTILLGSPNPYSLEHSIQLAVYKSACVRTADLTKNGYPDLIIGSHVDLPIKGTGYLPDNCQPHHSFIHIYWNGPDGLSEFRKTVLRSDASSYISIADFNNDGWLDIIAGSYHAGHDRDTNSFLYWNRKGKFHDLDRQLLYTHSASGTLAVDFNEDGFIDLAVSNHKYWGDHCGDSEVWWNGPDGFAPKHTTKLPTEGPHGLFAVEPGNQLDRSDSEFYTSTSYHAAGKNITGVSIEGEIPPKTSVKIRFAFADSEKGLDSAPWTSWFAPGKWRIGNGEFVRYQLALSAVNGLRSPRITAVNVEFE